MSRQRLGPSITCCTGAHTVGADTASSPCAPALRLRLAVAPPRLQARRLRRRCGRLRRHFVAAGGCRARRGGRRRHCCGPLLPPAAPPVKPRPAAPCDCARHQQSSSPAALPIASRTPLSPDCIYLLLQRAAAPAPPALPRTTAVPPRLIDPRREQAGRRFSRRPLERLEPCDCGRRRRHPAIEGNASRTRGGGADVRKSGKPREVVATRGTKHPQKQVSK